jgi:hypothetical protein
MEYQQPNEETKKKWNKRETVGKAMVVCGTVMTVLGVACSVTLAAVSCVMSCLLGGGIGGGGGFGGGGFSISAPGDS